MPLLLLLPFPRRAARWCASDVDADCFRRWRRWASAAAAMRAAAAAKVAVGTACCRGLADLGARADRRKEERTGKRRRGKALVLLGSHSRRAALRRYDPYDYKEVAERYDFSFCLRPGRRRQAAVFHLSTLAGDWRDLASRPSGSFRRCAQRRLRGRHGTRRYLNGHASQRHIRRDDRLQNIGLQHGRLFHARRLW